LTGKRSRQSHRLIWKWNGWLHVAGVSRVELAAPAADIVIPDDGYAVAGAISITDGGIAW